MSDGIDKEILRYKMEAIKMVGKEAFHTDVGINRLVEQYVSAVRDLLRTEHRLEQNGIIPPRIEDMEAVQFARKAAQRADFKPPEVEIQTDAPFALPEDSDD